ncbi:MAG: MutL protein [Clostridia bacterium]|nr:MutL protein [Clostridia bacterium]
MTVNAYLLIDFGSTFTKLTAVDVDNEVILATARDFTTVETDIMDGYNLAYAKLLAKLGSKEVCFVKKLACSSAAGGLKMIAIGLVAELTAEAAKRAALGAGARVLKVFDHQLTKRDIKAMEDLCPDMILLAGGTDGGNRDCIVYNAEKLVESKLRVPVVVVGNKNALDDIEEIFEDSEIYYSVADNVMPRLNVLHVEPAREKIREIFMERITDAKGMHLAKDMAGGLIMPTPAAVLKAAELLSLGTDMEDGLGDLIVIDIGGATTDVHSIAQGDPTQPGVTMKGLEEPLAKRTVEGDLGMRYSALSLWEAAGTRRIRKYIANMDINIEEKCSNLATNVEFVPVTLDEKEFDRALAKVAVEMSMDRHAGIIETVYTPFGALLSQTGKDLTQVKYVIGTGGVLVDSEEPWDILKAGLFQQENPVVLKPQTPNLMLDAEYIFSAMGLLSLDYPEKALRILKKSLIEALR